MIEITIPGGEVFNEATQEFYYPQETTLQLEHSLISISKWESKWHKSYLSSKDKTLEEARDYIRCMTMNRVADDKIYYCLTNENVEAINKYINDPMTATVINDKKSGGPSRVLTSELIYAQMIMLNIPVQFEKWHLNRLLMLIRVCSIEASPKSKKSSREVAAQYAKLNEMRRKALHSKG